MIGAIAGDIIGSTYEARPTTRTDFPLFHPHCHFTDDTVMTIAVADAILTGSEYAEKLREWYRLYPERGYGPGFRTWASAETVQPGLSFGNGSAMRVSPVGFAFDSLERVLEEARRSAVPSHGHPEGIKGAQAVAAAVFLAKTGSGRAEIKACIEQNFGYDLGEPLEQIRGHNRPDATCPGSVPQAITAFLVSEDVEDAIRNAVSLSGDADTVACIAGSIAQAYFGTVPAHIVEQVLAMLDDRMKRVVEEFTVRFN